MKRKRQHMCANTIYTPASVNEKGFSLIELMIAMSLSLVLILGVFQLFDLQKRSFELISSLNDREDNARLAMKILSDGIRMSDHWGGVPPESIQIIAGNLSTSPGACDEHWVFDTTQGIYGLEGAPTVAQVKGLPNKCIKKQYYHPNSDLLALRFGDSRDYVSETEISRKPYQKHYFLRAETGKSAIIFQGKQSLDAIQRLPNDGFHYTMPFYSSLFFLRPCQKKSNGCAEDTAVLTRLVLQGDRYIQQALVEGIEQMQFEYGVDENNNGLVDNYYVADKVQRWQQVLSVKVYVLVRNTLKDGAIDELNKVYRMNSSGTASSNTYTVPETGRYYSRRLYSSEVALRNRLAQ